MPLKSETRDITFVTRAFPGTATPTPDCGELAMDCVRPPAVIGGLRWWFRAVAGGILGGSIKAVLEEEGRLFGSTGNASPVRVSTTWEQLPSKEGGLGNNQSPIRYLAFGKNNFQAYLPAGFRFKVILRSTRSDALQAATSLLDLWIAFGGVGGRWRHGLGSMLSTHPPQQDPIALISEALGSLRPWLKENPMALSGEPTFPVLHPKFFEMRRLQLGTPLTEEASLAMCKGVWRDYRLTKKWSNPKYKDKYGETIVPNYKVQHTKNTDVFHGFLLNTSPGGTASIRFSMLGMPIPFSAWSEVEKDRKKAAVVWDQQDDGGRLASPIWLRPKQVAGSWSIYALGWKFDAQRGRGLRLARNSNKPQLGTLATSGTNQIQQVDDYLKHLAVLNWSIIPWSQGTNP